SRWPPSSRKPWLGASFAPFPGRRYYAPFGYGKTPTDELPERREDPGEKYVTHPLNGSRRPAEATRESDAKELAAESAGCRFLGRRSVRFGREPGASHRCHAGNSILLPRFTAYNKANGKIPSRGPDCNCKRSRAQPRGRGKTG